jgi:hypothetical protein
VRKIIVGTDRIGSVAPENGRWVVVRPAASGRFSVQEPASGIVGAPSSVSARKSLGILAKDLGGGFAAKRVGSDVHVVPLERRPRRRTAPSGGLRTTLRVPPDLEQAAARLAARESISHNAALIRLAELGAVVDDRTERRRRAHAAVSATLDALTDRPSPDGPPVADPEQTAEALGSLIDASLADS